MSVFLLVFAVLILSYILYKASEQLISGIQNISNKTIFSTFFLASIFTGLATSMPELFIALTSSIQGYPEFAFGNAIGSNIANIGLVLPVAVLVSGMVLNINKSNFSRQTILVLLSASLFPVLLALDGMVSRIDGLFLMFLFFVYAVYIFNKRPSGIFGFKNILSRLKHSFTNANVLKSWFTIFASLLLLVLSAYFMLSSGLKLASILGISPFLVALFIVAPGTSLPELFVTMVAIKKREVDVLYGDLYGSLVVNANLVIGLAAFIAPIRISVLSQYSLSIVSLIVLFSLFIIFSFTKRRLQKWEAVALLLVYFIFFFLESYV